MEKPFNNLILSHKQHNHSLRGSKQGVAPTSMVHIRPFLNSVEVIIQQNHGERVKGVVSYQKTPNISAKKIIVLNLNHPHAYGHIYSEVFSELYAVDETYPEYDCVLTRTTPLIQQIIECFNLNISNKIKFIHKLPTTQI